MNCPQAIVAYTDHVRECIPSFTPYARSFDIFVNHKQEGVVCLKATPTYARHKSYLFCIEGNLVTPIDTLPDGFEHQSTAEGRWFEEFFVPTAVPVAHVPQEDGRYLRNRGPISK